MPERLSGGKVLLRSRLFDDFFLNTESEAAAARRVGFRFLHFSSRTDSDFVRYRLNLNSINATPEMISYACERSRTLSRQKRPRRDIREEFQRTHLIKRAPS